MIDQAGLDAAARAVADYMTQQSADATDALTALLCVSSALLVGVGGQCQALAQLDLIRASVAEGQLRCELQRLH